MLRPNTGIELNYGFVGGTPGPPGPPGGSNFTSIVAGSQSVSIDTFTRIGTIDRSATDPTVVMFEVAFNTTDPLNAAEIRLFNTGTLTPVVGSLLSTVSTTNSVQIVNSLVLLAGAYELQLRLTVSDPAARAVCTHGKIF